MSARNGGKLPISRRWRPGAGPCRPARSGCFRRPNRSAFWATRFLLCATGQRRLGHRCSGISPRNYGRSFPPPAGRIGIINATAWRHPCQSGRVPIGARVRRFTLSRSAPEHVGREGAVGAHLPNGCVTEVRLIKFNVDERNATRDKTFKIRLPLGRGP